MSSFTKATSFSPILEGADRGKWRVNKDFIWYLHEPGGESVTVESGFAFDGASVPMLLTIWFPRIHADYIQSAALHDWMLEKERHRFSRKMADKVFKASLKALRNPKSRVFFMYSGVSTFGKIKERSNYWKTLSKEN